jgi:hypothetical protein
LRKVGNRLAKAVYLDDCRGIYAVRHSPPVVDDELTVWYGCVDVMAVAFVVVMAETKIRTVIIT